MQKDSIEKAVDLVFKILSSAWLLKQLVTSGNEKNEKDDKKD